VKNTKVIGEVGQISVPTSIWQMMLSTGMLLTCGNIIQHAFRGIMFPYKSSKVVTYATTTEKFTVKFTRTLYFGAFSWLVSLVVVTVLNGVSLILMKTSLTQYVSFFVGSSSSDCYAFLANAVLILLVTPIMCLAGGRLRKKSGKEYIERMRLHRDGDQGAAT
jgi:uncharacterized Tic20 family protein